MLVPSFSHRDTYYCLARRRRCRLLLAIECVLLLIFVDVDFYQSNALLMMVPKCQISLRLCVRFIVWHNRVGSTFTLTMIRWYMSNDQTHNKLSETDWDERLNRTTNIYKFYWFSAARWCSMVLVCSDAVGRCYSIFCVCIYFVERLDFDTCSTQSSVAWKRDEKEEEDEWSQHTTIPFLYLLRRSVLLVYLCTDEKRKRPLYIRGGNIRVGIFAAVFGIQLRYDDEGRIIFSDILRVCFRSIISTALWIIAPKPFLLMDSFSLSPKHHTENRKFLAFFVCVIYFSCSCIDFQMRLHELVFSIDCLSHAILLLLSA